MTRINLLLLFIASIALSFILYGNTIKGEFVYDDSFFAERTDLASPSNLVKIWGEPFRIGEPNINLYRPLVIFTIALNFILFGTGTASFHITSIILNGIVVFLVYLATLGLLGSASLGKNKIIAGFTALIFVFLPIHVEAVANIKSRDDILSALFILLALIVFLKAISEKITFRPVIFSALLFFLALLSKEYAVMALPLFLTLYWVKKKPGFGNLIRTGFIFTIPFLIYFFIRWRVLGEYAFGKENMFWYYAPMPSFGLSARIWTSFKMLFMYVQKTFIPFNLSATEHFNQLTMVTNPFLSVEAIFGIMLLAVIMVLIFNKKLRDTPLGLGALLFFISYFIFSKFVFTSGEIFAERWMYFPSFGLSLILGYGIYRLFRLQKAVALVVLVLILVLYSLVLIPRNRVWLNEKALYESMVRDSPNSAQGYIGMAYWYFYRDNLQMASYYVKQGQKVYHDHPRLLNMEAIFALNRRDFSEAVGAIRKSIEVAPSPINYLLSAIILNEEGKYKESLMIAQEYFNSSYYVPQSPTALAVRYVIALNLDKLGKKSEAKMYFDLTGAFDVEAKKAIESSFNLHP